MTTQFDFDAPEITASASVSPSTTVTLCMVPMANAILPLSAGRACLVQLDFVDTVYGFYARAYYMVTGGSPPTASLAELDGPSGGSAVINGSGDLDVKFNNANATRTYNVCVRVKQRWFGTT